MAVELSESRRRIIMNSPHIVTPTAAGLHMFETDMAAPLKECRVNFSPVQAGTGDPAPDNVRAITGWTGVSLTRCGKNLCPAATGTDIKKWDQIGGSTDAYYHDFTGFDPAQNFTLQATITELWTTASSKRLYLIGDTSSFVNPASSSVPVTKSTTRKPDANGRLRIQHNRNGLNSSDEYAASLTKIQLEKGSTATTYEPYNGVTIPLDWSSSAGTVYGGYVDLVRGVVVKTHECASIDEDMAIESYGVGHGVGCATYALPSAGANKNAVMVNRMGIRVRNSAASTWPTPGQLCLLPYNSATTYLSIGSPDTEDTSKQAWLDWLENNSPVQVVYELATPVTYPIDPVTLRTLRGLNNIWSDANGNIELSYWSH